MKRTLASPSLCSLASATFSPSLEGDFLQGSHPVQAAPGLGRSPLQEGDGVTPRICGRGGRAGLALHPAASPVGAPAGTRRAGRPVASRDPTATVVKAIFFLYLLKRAILKKALERGSVLLLHPFCAQDLEIRTPQPVLRAGYHTGSGAAPIPPSSDQPDPSRHVANPRSVGSSETGAMGLLPASRVAALPCPTIIPGGSLDPQQPNRGTASRCLPLARLRRFSSGIFVGSRSFISLPDT